MLALTVRLSVCQPACLSIRYFYNSKTKRVPDIFVASWGLEIPVDKGHFIKFCAEQILYNGHTNGSGQQRKVRIGLLYA